MNAWLHLRLPCNPPHRVTCTSFWVSGHTFCSHLAMRGAPARAIQDLAGHQDLATTQRRYMHLSPAALHAAIRLLDGPRPMNAVENTTNERRGEIVSRREIRGDFADFLSKVVEAAGVEPKNCETDK